MRTKLGLSAQHPVVYQPSTPPILDEDSGHMFPNWRYNKRDDTNAPSMKKMIRNVQPGRRSRESRASLEIE
jgi:hypothetical protein